MVFCYGSPRELIGQVLPYCVGDISLAQKKKVLKKRFAGFLV